MAKLVADSVLDAALNLIKTTADRLILCSAQPVNFAGVAAVNLAQAAVTSASFTGPADGDVSGRKLTVNAQADVDVTTTGTGDHVCLVDDTTSTLLYVTTCPNVNVDSNGVVDLGSWKIELADPS